MENRKQARHSTLTKYLFVDGAIGRLFEENKSYKACKFNCAHGVGVQNVQQQIQSINGNASFQSACGSSWQEGNTRMLQPLNPSGSRPFKPEFWRDDSVLTSMNVP